MSAAPTPRPWETRPDEPATIVRHDGLVVAMALRGSRDVPGEVALANAALIVRAVNAHDALVEAAEAHRAWSYAEKHSIGTFNARCCLCAHAESLTLEALAMVNGDEPPAYKGAVGLVVWPYVARTETDRETGRDLVRQCLEHERAAIAKAEPKP